VDNVVDAARTFFEHIAAIGWGSIAVALLCHLAKVAARTRSWRNIVAAAYPDSVVRWRSVFGSYAAGVGVNALLPARGGDVLKLYLIKHRVEGSTYPTLTATLLVETLFDLVVASGLLIWALTQDVLPGIDVIPRLPEVDWLWLFQRPQAALGVAAGALFVGFVVGVWASKHVAAFWLRVAQGFAILRSPGRYAAHVLPWQALDWGLRLATIFFLLRAFGVPTGFHNALLVQVSASLSTILPLTPAGIGTEQALLVYVLRGEAPATTLVSFSVGMKLVVIAANVALGLAAIALMLRTVRIRRVLDRAKAAAPS
jgi:uncharacterized membrane protein YbhN (UPF0104 family)